ncbi:Osmotic growth protein [Scheffersomyces stipitis CBS 6054]|uniref:Osmotic growth protein n=1 Tax=Scheffersomyces stipitis (strain ATCC 58785 / CBS 6054 / NBRC 10063 / NRRL Y-11545) TaxID=322104 RepID=A3GI52_PICST|nr:Osmotic growth protein [Scheffersomyces stipitis CBS 6054]EAZ62928.2 Osmotic growth protein [Scheffersomyces stipitis CBS 6054]
MSSPNTLPRNPIIIVGGGLAGLSAAHQTYLRGANVILLDKQGFLSGNSGKATSGINGALTRTQVDLEIKDSVQQFYDDTLATAKDRARPDLIKVLTYHSADAVHWLQEVFDLDLTVVSRLGGHSQPRTHRGKDSKFPGMAITYRLLETLEDLALAEPHRVLILKNCQVIDLVKQDHKVTGVKYKNLLDKTKHELTGPVIMSTGGYAADFTKNSLLKKYRPDIIDLPSTNGNHATGDGQKIIMKNKGVGTDLDKVQVHPTGLIDYNDTDTISGKKVPRFLFLGAEALRGEGGIILNAKGERFVDELGPRDYVSGEMEKQLKLGNGPLRLVLNEASEKNLEFHVKHYKARNLMKTISGKQLLADLGLSGHPEKLESVFATYNKAARGEIKDPFGKKFFPATPFEYNPDASYHVSFITRVLHFTMGGVRINDKAQVMYQVGEDEYEPFEGLYAAGELAGGIHGHNRLGGSSLLACVVYGRLAADQATSYYMNKLSEGPVGSSSLNRLQMINLHIDPNNPQKVTIEWGEGNPSTGDINSSSTATAAATATSNSNTSTTAPAATPAATATEKFKSFEIPAKEFTYEDVAKHNKREDCWVVVKNVVLDLTPFLKNHPGGMESIVNYAGRDATESFEMLHEDNFIEKYTRDCVLGRIKGKTPALNL